MFNRIKILLIHIRIDTVLNCFGYEGYKSKLAETYDNLVLGFR